MGGGFGLKKNFVRPFGPQPGQKIRVARDPPLDPPLNSYSHSSSLVKLVRLKSGR